MASNAIQVSAVNPRVKRLRQPNFRNLHVLTTASVPLQTPVMSITNNPFLSKKARRRRNMAMKKKPDAGNRLSTLKQIQSSPALNTQTGNLNAEQNNKTSVPPSTLSSGTVQKGPTAGCKQLKLPIAKSSISVFQKASKVLLKPKMVESKLPHEVRKGPSHLQDVEKSTSTFQKGEKGFYSFRTRREYTGFYKGRKEIDNWQKRYGSYQKGKVESDSFKQWKKDYDAFHKGKKTSDASQKWNEDFEEFHKRKKEFIYPRKLRKEFDIYPKEDAYHDDKEFPFFEREQRESNTLKERESISRAYSERERRAIRLQESDELKRYYDLYYDKQHRVPDRRRRESKDYELDYSARKYPYYWYGKDHKTRRQTNEEIWEDVSDAPLDEGDFEEVEVASVEDTARSSVRVGFHSYMVRYFPYRTYSFFRPKMYYISQKRTIVNYALQKDMTIRIDFVSEIRKEDAVKEKYVGKESKPSLSVSIDCEIEKDKVTNNDIKVLVPSDKNDNLDEKNYALETDIAPEDKENSTEEKNVDLKISADGSQMSSVEESFAVVESDAVDVGTSEEVSDDKTAEEQLDSSACKVSLMKSPKKTSKVSLREYYKSSIKLDSNDFYQGESAIQESLDSWKSHLIGLEYVMEVRDKMKEVNAIIYYCGLCDEEIHLGNKGGRTIIDHIVNYKHVCNYMEKHFPSYENKFEKTVGSFVKHKVFQKCCEEVNQKLGYQFMCIVNTNFFQSNMEKIKQAFSEMRHWSESDIDMKLYEYLSEFERILSEDVKNTIDNIKGILWPHDEGVPQTVSTYITPLVSRRKKLETSNVFKCNLIVLTPEDEQPVASGTGPHLETPKDAKAFGKFEPTITPQSSRPYLRQVQMINPEVAENKAEVANVTSKRDLRESDIKFKPVTKKAGVYPQYRSKTNVVDDKQDKDFRIVRMKADEKNEETVAEESVKRVVQAKEENVCDTDLLEDVDVAYEEEEQLEEETVLDEVSDAEFSDEVVVITDVPLDDHSDEKESDKIKSSSKQKSHQKAAHHKHCIKRILGQSKETSHKDLTTKGSESSGDIPLSKRSSEESGTPDYLKQLLRSLSRSPVRKQSKSPLRRRRSPYKKYPLNQRSRRYSRSPKRYSRSPGKRRSRSPAKRWSRSPGKRRSRSPVKRRSRSPAKRRARSPIKKRSRSPYRKRSRSPLKRRSRSPRKRSRTPPRRRSRSPRRRSPFKRRSISPVRTFNDRFSRSPDRAPVRSSYRKETLSPLSDHSLNRSLSSQGYGRSKQSSYKSDTYIKSSYDRHSKYDISPPGSYTSSSRPSMYSHHKNEDSESERAISDLDPVSDEDESKYFNISEGSQHIDVIKSLPEPTRTMILKVLQRFSITNVNPNDPSFHELMQFVSSHGSDIQNLIAQPTGYNVNPGPSLRPQNPALQQYLANLIPSGLPRMQQPPAPSTSVPYLVQTTVPPAPVISFPPPASAPSGIPYPPPPQTVSHLPPQQSSLPQHSSYPQPAFQQQPSVKMQFPTVGMNVHRPPISTQVPQQQHMLLQQQQLPLQSQQPQQMLLQRSQPPPQNPYNLISPQKSLRNIPTDSMFKDLKATVNKLFGANIKKSLGLPAQSFPSVSDPGKGDLNRSTRPQMTLEAQNTPANAYSHDPTGRPQDSFGTNFSKGGSSDLYYNDGEARQKLTIPPPDAKVSFCDIQQPMSSQRNLFPVMGDGMASTNPQSSVNEVKKSLAQRLAAVLVKVGMIDVPGYLLQEMLMKIGAFSTNPSQDITENEIIGILRKFRYL